MEKQQQKDNTQPGNHNNLVAILGSMLKTILGVQIPCASNLPGEFLGEHKDFTCIPLLTHKDICFVQIPVDIIDLRKMDFTNFHALLDSKGIKEEEDIEDLTKSLVDNMRYNLARNQTPPFYPWTWIPLHISTNIQTMLTPFTRNGKKCFIHSMATIIPVNEDYRIRNVFYTQLIAILLKRVERDVNTKLEYSYYISNAILYLFIAVIG